MVDPRSRVTSGQAGHMEEDATWLTKHLASWVFPRGRSISSPQPHPCQSEPWLAFSVSMLDRPGSVIWFLLVRRTQYKWAAASEQGTHNLTVIIHWNENYSHSINMISSTSFYSLHVGPQRGNCFGSKSVTCSNSAVWGSRSGDFGVFANTLLGPSSIWRHWVQAQCKKASDWTILDSSPVLVKLFPNVSATVIFQEIQEQKLNGIHPMKRQCLLSNNLTIRKKVTTITLLEHAKHRWGERTSRYKHWGDCWRNLQVSACEIQITLIEI